MNGEGGGDLGGGSVLKRWVNTMIQNDVREKQNHKTKQWTVRSNGRRQNERQQTKRGGMQAGRALSEETGAGVSQKGGGRCTCTRLCACTFWAALLLERACVAFREQTEQGSENARGECGMASAPARGQARNKPRSSAVIALLHVLLARELLGHRLGRKLRGPGTLSPDPRECSSYIADLNPRTPGRVK